MAFFLGRSFESQFRESILREPEVFVFPGPLAGENSTIIRLKGGAGKGQEAVPQADKRGNFKVQRCERWCLSPS